MRIAAVVLAAGSSRRLGRPKQIAVVGGETLLERAVRTAIEAGLEPVIVVLQREGELADAVRAQGCEVVMNPDAVEGMASSIRCGVRRAADAEASGAVLMVCDQVGVRGEHLREVIGEGATVAGSGYGGSVGTPAYFPAVRFEDLLKLRGDTGARGLLGEARVVPDEALALDVDTEAELQLARELYGS